MTNIQMQIKKKSKPQQNVGPKSAHIPHERLSAMLSPDCIRADIGDNNKSIGSNGISRKRRSSSVYSNTESKRSRRSTADICEFLGIQTDSLILRLNGYDRGEALKVSSKIFDSILHSHYYSPAKTKKPVENILKDLHRLHFLLDAMHPDGVDRIRASKKIATVNDLCSEEYKIEKIVDMNLNAENRQQEFKVKWYGSDTPSFEPLQTMYDCYELATYTKREMAIHLGQLDGLWSELTTGRAKVSDASISEADAIAQISEFDAFQFQWDLILLIKCRTFKETRKVAIVIQKRCESALRLLPYLNKRLEQLRKIFIWQMHINNCEKSSDLRIENVIDFEVPPDDFEYRNDVELGEGVTIQNDPPIACECTNECGCGENSECCLSKSEAEFAYNKNRSICVPQGMPVFECNKRCKCGPECINRVVQRGGKHTLTIFKTSNGCGWGVRTEKAIANGHFVCEYVGEVIMREEAERREKICGSTYLFDLNFDTGNSKYSIDAAHYGNFSRFVKHSCNPNMGVWPVWVDCSDKDLPKVCFFTLRDIDKGEEITIDYTDSFGSEALVVDDSIENDESLRDQKV